MIKTLEFFDSYTEPELYWLNLVHSVITLDLLKAYSCVTTATEK
jgi:hypothetical protein